MPRILLLEPEPTVRDRYQRCLTKAGYEIDTEQSDKPDLVMLDWVQPSGQTGGNLALALGKRWPDVPIIVLCDSETPEVSLAMRRAKLRYALPWPAPDDDIRKLVASFLRQATPSPTLARLREPLHQLIGESRAWLDVLRDVARAIDGIPGRSILLLGPAGSGKDQLARAIGNLRTSGEYRSANVANLPDTLFESLVFGHTRGSFSDAHSDHIGLAEAVGTGVLFLNEIGTLSLTQQTKLLVFAEKKVYQRLGEDASRPERQFQGRLVFATNENLELGVRQGRVRADMLGRLRSCGAVIELPRLVDRAEDVELLFNHRLRQAAQELNHSGSFEVDNSVLQLLKQARFPDNVRTLDGYADEAASCCHQAGRSRIVVGDLPDQFFATPDAGGLPASIVGELTKLLAELPWPESMYSLPLKASAGATVWTIYEKAFSSTFLKEYLQRLHAQHNGHFGNIAKAVGLTDKPLRDWFEAAGLKDKLPRGRSEKPPKSNTEQGD